TNPSGVEPEPIAHVNKGSSALEGVGAIPVDNKQKQENLTQPQPKNATEYVTGALSNAYTTAKDTLGNIIGTNQTSTTTDKAHAQKSDK
ncbi:13094_t:CDS:2, partial [Funneliformis mosseae]